MMTLKITLSQSAATNALGVEGVTAQSACGGIDAEISVPIATIRW
jgi:hypothetical protein